jgi:hypothetical protein
MCLIARSSARTFVAAVRAKGPLSSSANACRRQLKPFEALIMFWRLLGSMRSRELVDESLIRNVYHDLA